MKFTRGFDKDYLEQSAKQRLVWTSKAGSVLLNIRFERIKRNFLVTTDMANMLLYLENTPKMLNHFIC